MGEILWKRESCHRLFLTLIALISRMLHHVACIKLKFGCADADVADEIRITDVLSFPPCSAS